jgi:anthranilate/para-aminobenzoate synthase component I
VGYFSFTATWPCITIRTSPLEDGKAYVPAGGARVNDSELEAEFQEAAIPGGAPSLANQSDWESR